MKDFVTADLKKAEITPFHKTLLEHTKGLINFSRNHMTQYYSMWDAMDLMYRGERPEDIEDQKAILRREPGKIIIPMTYMQVQTFVAFCYTLFTQREYIFELIGSNGDNQTAAKLGEALLERDCTYNNMRGDKLYNWLLDIGRFGIGVLKHSWWEETVSGEEEVQTPAPTFLGVPLGAPRTETKMVDKVSWQGNKVIAISPYRFFPDVRLPLQRFQEGEFCGSEDEYTHTALKQMEKDGIVAGVEFIRTMNYPLDNDRRLNNVGIARNSEMKMFVSQSKGVVLVTECQIDLVPSEFEIDGQKMGEEDYPIKHLVWYANDHRIVRVEPMGYLHNKFTYDVGQFSPDLNRFISEGIAGNIAGLQDVVNWYINSHITSVRKVIGNFLVIDPTGIEASDIEERRSIIRLKPAAARSGVDRWVHQLQVNDVTGEHMKDAASMQDFAQMATGISENMLGQFASGRRSAGEAHLVSQGATSRMKMVATMLWECGLRPLGEKMLANLRDGLDQETYVRMRGATVVDPQTGLINSEFKNFVPVDKSKLVDNFDFEVFDGTLPSEKGFMAQTLQDVLVAMITNPVAAQVFGMNPKALLDEILTLRGIKGLERFAIPGGMQQALGAAAVQNLTSPPQKPNQPPTQNGVHANGKAPVGVPSR